MDSEAAAGRARQGGLSAAGPSAVAGEAEEPRAFKGALTFLGFPLTNGRPRGRKREGGQSGFLSPPPRCLAHNFPARRWKGGGGGRRLGALELLRKIGARPRGLGAHGLSTSALAPSCPNPVRASRADRALATQPKTLREAFRQTRPLESLRDG